MAVLTMPPSPRSECPVAVWSTVQHWLNEEPNATDRELFQGLQENLPDSFQHGQLRTLQRRAEEWRTAVAKQLMLGVETQLSAIGGNYSEEESLMEMGPAPKPPGFNAFRRACEDVGRPIRTVPSCPRLKRHSGSILESLVFRSGTFGVRMRRDKYQILQTRQHLRKEHPARMTSTRSVTFFREATRPANMIVANQREKKWAGLIRQQQQSRLFN
jgi:hypothetical protein